MVLPTDNAVTGKLVADPRVGFFSFIGSAAVGWMLRSTLAPGTQKMMVWRSRAVRG